MSAKNEGGAGWFSAWFGGVLTSANVGSPAATPPVSAPMPIASSQEMIPVVPPNPKTMSRAVSGPALSKLGLKLAVAGDTYMLRPIPSNVGCCTNMIRLSCHSAPMVYERVDLNAPSTLEFSHPHPCGICLGCPPGSTYQAGVQYRLHERIGKKKKVRVGATKACCLNGMGLCVCPCCYSINATQKLLSIVDAKGTERFTIQRQLKSCWYFNVGAETSCTDCGCARCIYTYQAISNCCDVYTHYYSGRIVSIHTLPIFGPLKNVHAPRVHVGDLKSVMLLALSLDVNACCLPVPMPLTTLASEFVPVEGSAPLSDEEAKLLTLLTVNWPKHTFVDSFRGFPRAPIPFAMGTECTDFGLQYTQAKGGPPPLIEYVPLSHAYAAGWIVGK